MTLLCTAYELNILNAFRNTVVNLGSDRLISFHSGDPGELGTSNLIAGLTSVAFNASTLNEYFNQILTYVTGTPDRFSTDNTQAIPITSSSSVNATVTHICISSVSPAIKICRIPLLNSVSVTIGNPAEIPIGELNLSFLSFVRNGANRLLESITRGITVFNTGLGFALLYNSGNINSLGTELSAPGNVLGLTRPNTTYGSFATPSGSPTTMSYGQQLDFGTATANLSIGALVLSRGANSADTQNPYFIKVFDPPLLVDSGDPVIIVPNDLTISLD